MASDGSIYEFEHAVERVSAAVEAARSLPFTFTLTARCENYLCGRPDIDDTIRRLQAFQEAGADVLYAPGLATREDIISVVSSVDRPVNVLAGSSMSLKELSDMGVKRISVGSTLTRAALGEFIRAATEMKETGTFTFADKAVGFKDISEIFGN
jgi:2-methylisocitrate lyase-like PEP mutase family enzyme